MHTHARRLRSESKSSADGQSSSKGRAKFRRQQRLGSVVLTPPAARMHVHMRVRAHPREHMQSTHTEACSLARSLARSHAPTHACACVQAFMPTAQARPPRRPCALTLACPYMHVRHIGELLQNFGTDGAGGVCRGGCDGRKKSCIRGVCTLRPKPRPHLRPRPPTPPPLLLACSLRCAHVHSYLRAPCAHVKHTRRPAGFRMYAPHRNVTYDYASHHTGTTGPNSATRRGCVSWHSQALQVNPLPPTAESAYGDDCWLPSKLISDFQWANRAVDVGAPIPLFSLCR